MTIRQQNDWHLSKSISLSHIGSTVIAVVGIVMYISSIEKQVAVQGANILNIKSEMVKNQQSNHDMFKRIEKTMDKMDSKMDRLFDLFHQEKTKGE